MTSEAHPFFQSDENCAKILPIQKKIEKVFFELEIIAFVLVALTTRFYWQTILFMGYQYVNKQSQDFRYY